MYKQEFCNSVDQFIVQVNKGGLTSPLDALSDATNIDKEWIQYLIASIPEILLSAIAEKNKKFGELTETWNLTAVDHPSEFEGIVSCHALSPMGDTISLLSDLGRGARIAASLNKDYHIMLANRDWTRFNWVVKDFGEQNLKSNQNWRQNLYKSIGCKVAERDLENAPNVSRQQIEDEAASYTELARALFGKDNIGKKLSSEKAKELVTKLSISTMQEPSICLTKNDLVQNNIGKELKIIKQLMERLRRVDETTFMYYFTQRYQQHGYSKFLKVAIRSEKNFDGPFYEIDSFQDSTSQGIKKSIYFKDYILRVNPSTKLEEFVIPYYFPSGSLYNTEKNIESCIDKVIMLDDFESKEKFLKIANQISYPHNARLVSDLLSFLHFYVVTSKTTTRKIKSDIRKILKEFSDELADSWTYYCKPKADFFKQVHIWKDYLFCKWPEQLQLPYFYIPYLIYLKQEETEQFNETLFHLFNLAVKNIGFPDRYNR